MVSGSNNTVVGYNAGGVNLTGSNNIVIGANAVPSAAAVSNETTIGNTSSGILRIDVTGTSVSGSLRVAGSQTIAGSLAVAGSSILQDVTIDSLIPSYTSVTANPYTTSHIGYTYYLAPTGTPAVTGYGTVGALTATITVGGTVSTTSSIPIGIWLVSINILILSAVTTLNQRLDFNVGGVCIITIVAQASTSTYYQGTCVVIHTNTANAFTITVRSTAGTTNTAYNNGSSITYTRIA